MANSANQKIKKIHSHQWLTSRWAFGEVLRIIGSEELIRWYAAPEYDDDISVLQICAGSCLLGVVNHDHHLTLLLAGHFCLSETDCAPKLATAIAHAAVRAGKECTSAYCIARRDSGFENLLGVLGFRSCAIPDSIESNGLDATCVCFETPLDEAENLVPAVRILPSYRHD